MEQISIISLVTNASTPVQIVMAILALFSIISWAIIFSKWLVLLKAKAATNKFNKQYTNSNSITTLYSSINNTSRVTTCQMFYLGLSEYNRMNKSGINNKEALITNIERTLSATIDEELSGYENKLSTLATFGSVSPYIGLLGTVWGIMHAFIGLSNNAGQATLASVAPGIAEALIATAIGLFVAIPAYMAYNKFSADISYLDKKMNRFGDEFLNMINRKLSANTDSTDN